MLDKSGPFSWVSFDLKNMELKIGMYLRKSTDSEDRQVQSIDDQKRELDKLNRSILHTYIESKSAKEPGREEFNHMISDIESRKIDAVLCWKVNRLARNPIDGGRIQWLLQQE